MNKKRMNTSGLKTGDGNAGKKKKFLRVLFVCACCFAVIVFAVLVVIVHEMKSCRLQVRYFSALANEFTFAVDSGPSSETWFPSYGPHNIRRGYTALPGFIQSLQSKGYRILRQARFPAAAARLCGKGINPVFREDDQAGLRITDRNDKLLFESYFPSPVYVAFDSIPPLLVSTLLFIEDRHLLDSINLKRNPAIDWPRFLGAGIQYGLSRFGRVGNVPGASTLATQIEKFRYSRDGLTMSGHDKLYQMVSASIRAYSRGENTLSMRRAVVTSYLNTAPLAAFPRYGEVNGIGEGLEVWYGVSFDSANAALNDSLAPVKTRGLFYRMALGLIIAHRRPNYYLLIDPEALDSKTDYYLGLLCSSGVISDSLYGAALHARPELRTVGSKAQKKQQISSKKPANTVRSPLLQLLNSPRLYDLDRLDCTVGTTIDSSATANALALFRLLRDPRTLDSLGLRGERMIRTGDPLLLIHSIILFERVGHHNFLRLQADSYENPLNINTGIKLDLGSTAKLRTLVNYLQIIEELHDEYRGMTPGALRSLSIAPGERLRSWVRDFLVNNTDTALTAMLDAALKRTYSASPAERFYTGGGIHRFGNFDKRHNSATMSVSEAFRHSVNLVFVRLMRDIVDYYSYRIPGVEEMLADTTGELRERYLRRYIDFESRVFLNRFYRRLSAVPPEGMADTLSATIRSSAERMAAIYCTVVPKPSIHGLHAFLAAHGFGDTSNPIGQRLFEKYTSSELSIADRGFLVGIHPLKLWTAQYLVQNPSATLSQLQQAGIAQQESVYRWLFTTSRNSARNSRIRQIVEMDAFKDIHQSWKDLGYPFPELVPSLATALGSSADRPGALAALAGIIQNGGMLYPTHRISTFHFAAGTPYEVKLASMDPDTGVRVLSAPIASAVRSCLIDVVNNGTAIRVKQAFHYGKMSLQVGGKTGTGDHRHRRISAGGARIEEKVMNRSATFVFFIGERFFGVISAMVPGEAAKDFTFTSSYPVQLLRQLAPALGPLLAPQSVVFSPASTPELPEIKEPMPLEAPSEVPPFNGNAALPNGGNNGGPRVFDTLTNAE